PVVVDLPKDILNPHLKLPYHYPQEVSLRSYNPTVHGHQGQIKRAVKTLLEAKSPVLYIGGGIITAGANLECTQLAEQLRLPITSSLMGLGGVNGHHPQFLG